MTERIASTWQVRRHRWLVVVGACLALYGFLVVRASAAEPIGVELIGSTDPTPADATRLDLSTLTFSSVRTTIEDAAAGSTVALVVPGVDSIDDAGLDGALLVLDVDQRALALVGHTQIADQDVEGLILVDFPNSGTGAPDVVLSARANSLALDTLVPEWKLDGVEVALVDGLVAVSTDSIDARDLDLVPEGSTVDHAERFLDDLTVANQIPQGLTVAGGVDVAGLVPGLTDATSVRARGQLSGDFDSIKDPSTLSGTLSLRALLDASMISTPGGVTATNGDPDAPADTTTGGWFVELTATKTAGEKSLALSGGGDIVVASSDGVASLHASVQLEVITGAGGGFAFVGDADGKIGELEPSLGLAFRLPNSGSPSVSLSADKIPLDDSGKLFLDSVAAHVTGDAFTLDFTIAGAPTIGDLAAIIGADAPATIASAPLKADVAGSISIGSDGLALSTALEVGKANLTATMARSRGNNPTMVVALTGTGIALDTLVPDAGLAGMVVPDFGVVVASGAVDLSQLPSPLKDLEFEADGPGIYLSASINSGNLPADVREALASIGITSNTSVRITGQLPLFGSDTLALEVELGSFSGAELGPVGEVIDNLDAKVRIAAERDNGRISASFGLVGSITLRIPEFEEVGGTTGAVDLVTLDVAGELKVGTGQTGIVLSGSLGSVGWPTPLGINWLSFDNFAIEIAAGRGAGGGNISVGARVAATFGPEGGNQKDIDASFAIAASSNIVDAGFRMASQSGFGLSDIVTVANSAIGLGTDFSDLGWPDVQLRNLEMSFSTVVSDGLCLDAGFAISADLYLSESGVPVADNTGVETDDCGREVPTSTSSCSVAEDCRGRVKFILSTGSGILVDTEIKAIDFGPVGLDDAKLYLSVPTAGFPEFELRGGITVAGANAANGAIAVSSDGFNFQIETAGTQGAGQGFLLVGTADFGLEPTFAIRGFLRDRGALAVGSAVVNAATEVYNALAGADEPTIYLRCLSFDMELGASAQESVYGSATFRIHYALVDGAVRNRRVSEVGADSEDGWDLSQSIIDNLEALTSFTDEPDTIGCGIKPDLFLEQINFDGTSPHASPWVLAGDAEREARQNASRDWTTATGRMLGAEGSNPIGFLDSASQLDARDFSFHVDWGDGTRQDLGVCDGRDTSRACSSQNPWTHQYSSAGSYPVRVWVEDAEAGVVVAVRDFTAEIAEVGGFISPSGDGLTRLGTFAEGAPVEPLVTIAKHPEATSGTFILEAIWTLPDDGWELLQRIDVDAAAFVNGEAQATFDLDLPAGHHTVEYRLNYTSTGSDNDARIIDRQYVTLSVEDAAPILDILVAPNGTGTYTLEEIDKRGFPFNEIQTPFLRLGIDDALVGRPGAAGEFTVEVLDVRDNVLTTEVVRPTVGGTVDVRFDRAQLGDNPYRATVIPATGPSTSFEFTLRTAPSNDRYDTTTGAVISSTRPWFLARTTVGANHDTAGYDEGSQGVGFPGDHIACGIGSTWVRMELVGDADASPDRFEIQTIARQDGATIGETAAGVPIFQPQEIGINVFARDTDGSPAGQVSFTELVPTTFFNTYHHYRGEGVMRDLELRRWSLETPLAEDAVAILLVEIVPTGVADDCDGLRDQLGRVDIRVVRDPVVNDHYADADQLPVEFTLSSSNFPMPVDLFAATPAYSGPSVPEASGDDAPAKSVWSQVTFASGPADAAPERTGRYRLEFEASGGNGTQYLNGLTVSRGTELGDARTTVVQASNEHPNSSTVVATTEVDFRGATDADPYIIGFHLHPRLTNPVFRWTKLAPEHDDITDAHELTTPVGPNGWIFPDRGTSLGTGFGTMEDQEEFVARAAGIQDGDAGTNSVWFSWVAPRDGRFAVDARASRTWSTDDPAARLATKVSLYRGSLPFFPQLTAVGTVTGGGTFTATAGQKYWFRIVSVDPGDGGQVIVDVSADEQILDTSAPTASDDAVELGNDQREATFEVLTNDTDPDGDLLRVSNVRRVTDGAPEQGSARAATAKPSRLECTGSGRCTYDAGDFVGEDRWSYDISDGHFTKTATISITVPALDIPPPPVSNLTASNVTHSSATVSWDAPDTTLAVDGYTVTVSPAMPGGPIQTTATSVDLTGLAPETTHTVTVTADNHRGSSSPVDVQFTTGVVPPDPDPDPDPDPAGPDGAHRLAGAGRYDTAVQVALDRFDPADVDTVFVATGTNFPDALAGGPLAAQRHAPILLVSPTTLPEVVADALATLGPSEVIAFGGAGAVSDDVLAAAAAAAGGAATDRVAGNDRYETAAAIADAMDTTGVSGVFLATGTNFPDALAGGPASGGAPILLSHPSRLPDATRTALAALTPSSVTALGGAAVVPAEILSEAATVAGGAATARLAGDGRFDTAAAIATTLGDVDTVYVAVGTNFPDALAASPAASAEGAPIVLTLTDTLPQATIDYLDGLSAIRRIVILGGTAVVDAGVAQQLEGFLTP